MIKKNQFRNFTNIETRRTIILNRNSSASDIEKFDRQVSAKASLRSADLREYWQTGLDRNYYLDELAAREANEISNPIPTPSEYINILNLTRSAAEKASSYSDLTEVEKMMYKSQTDIKNTVKREEWRLYQTRKQQFRDDNAWLIMQLSDMIDPHYLQFLIDTQNWEKEVSKDRSFEIKMYLKNRSMSIQGSTATAVERQEDLWSVEFGNVSNYESQIAEFKVKMRSYLACLDQSGRIHFNSNLENVFKLRYRLTHESWRSFHLTSNQFVTVDDLISAIEIENQRMNLLKKNMAPKRQLVINNVTNYHHGSDKRFKPNKSDFKSSKSAIDWKEVGDHIRKLPKPGDQKELTKPCCYCTQSKVIKVRDLSKTHSGDRCFQRYPDKRK